MKKLNCLRKTKIISFLFIILFVVFSTFFLQVSSNNLFSYNSGQLFGTRTYYLYSSSSNLFSYNSSQLFGTRTYYLYSSSSNAKIITTDIRNSTANLPLFAIKGESVFLNERNSKGIIDEFINNFLNNYEAKIQLLERGDLVNSEYYYSNKIAKHVIINGCRVNVHIAKSDYGVTIGVPIIYGSF